jgi:hypothetical protein
MEKSSPLCRNKDLFYWIPRHVRPLQGSFIGQRLFSSWKSIGVPPR